MNKRKKEMKIQVNFDEKFYHKIINTLKINKMKFIDFGMDFNGKR